MSRALALVLLIVFGGAVRAQGKPEPLVKKVKTSIARGVEFLISKQAGDGGWGYTLADNDSTKTTFTGGSTGLAVLALLNCEGVIDDPKLEKARVAAIAKGLNNLRRLEAPNTVYVRSLQTMAFAEARTEPLIVKANVDWLIKARVFKDGNFMGWDYNSRPAAIATDASNSQYAMLALWYARQAGVEIDRKVWQDIQSYYTRTQNPNGWWNYSAYYDRADLKGPSQTMTIAGICGLLISGAELNGGREPWPPASPVKNCGAYVDDDALARAFLWHNGNPARKIPSQFKLDLPERTYYHLYGLERVGRLSGMRFFGEHDWYREGCEFLVKNQDSSGAWPARQGHDRWPHVNTSFALLFLSKGRTPVLISKLVTGTWPRREDDTDWNNDRNDLRHLTEYLSRTDLFGKKTLAWQTYDIRRSVEAQAKRNDDDAIVADMLQTPILYITGHSSPRMRLQDDEKRLILRYVQNGGFLFAEACCGSKDFDTGIKDLVADLWEGGELRLLDSTHPVWTCFNVINPGDPFKLYGVQAGCRTVMIYSPQDLSCHWESNRYKDGATKRAFELGANIVAFATGRTPPQPRLTPIEIARADTEPKAPAGRGFFTAAQIRYSAENWQPAPRAMSNLLEHVHKTQGLDVDLRTSKIFLRDKRDLALLRFFYLHGREKFRFDAKEIDNLRFNLENGGLLLADACCGNEVFDKSFRELAQQLFPKEKLVRVSTDPKSPDRLFSEALNGKGEGLTAANIQCRIKANGPLVKMEPYLEGIQIAGRWVVLYSKYDLGCALERNTSPDCVGYDHASALRIAGAAVLYSARP